MLTILVGVDGFQFMRVHKIFKKYSLTPYESVWKLFSRVSRMMIDCIITMLKDRSRVRLHMKATAGTCWQFKSMKRLVLNEINGLLSDIEETSKQYQFHVDFSKWDHIGKLHRLPSGDEAMGTMQISDYINVEIITPLLAALDDLCCALELRACKTTNFCEKRRSKSIYRYRMIRSYRAHLDLYHHLKPREVWQAMFQYPHAQLKLVNWL